MMSPKEAQSDVWNYFRKLYRHDSPGQWLGLLSIIWTVIDLNMMLYHDTFSNFVEYFKYI